MVTSEQLWQLIEFARVRMPIVFNLSNDVMFHDSAAAISVIGGVQATVQNPDEASELANAANSLAINVGTPDDAWVAAAGAATDVALEKGKPWVIDPVAYGFTTYRTQVVDGLVAKSPAVIKGNASEIIALTGVETEAKAAESAHGADEAIENASHLAEKTNSVVAVSGAVDHVFDAERHVRLSNGDPMMARLIGTGCMTTSVIGVYLGVTEDSFEATLTGLALMGVAGEIAAERSAGPGSLKPALLDALYGMERKTFISRLKMTSQSR